MTDRAQSNVLGYVLLFGVVFLSITAAATLGFDALTSARDTSVSTNAELSMEGLASSVEDIRESNVSARTSVFRMNSGTLTSGEDTRITVEVSGEPDPIIDDEPLQPIVYRFQDTAITYEAGTLVRQQGGGQRMLREPDFVLDNDADGTIVLPVLLTTNDEETSVSGSTATTYFERTATTVYTDEVDTEVEIEITPDDSDRASTWERQLNDEITDGNPCSTTGGDVECSIDLDGDTPVVVRGVWVDYEYAV